MRDRVSNVVLSDVSAEGVVALTFVDMIAKVRCKLYDR
jgi:hypothetical protein